MSDCARAYTELRDQVVDSAENYLSNEDLKYFINRYHSILNSKRRCSYINNFNDLITVLENRGFIGEVQVEQFEEIVMRLPDCDILKEMIDDYQCHRERYRLRRPYVNNGKIISTHSDDLKRICKQFPKHIRFGGFLRLFKYWS
jgi:saccharopine dehydrogenase-like NADP-dependent oxidoreductase